jgi:hypothetical protein
VRACRRVGGRTRYVVHDDGDGGVADIAGDEAAEALLAGRVPAGTPRNRTLRVVQRSESGRYVL